MDVESVSTPIVWEGQAAGQVLIRDITERKAAEEAVRESDARLRVVIANVPVVVFALDAQGVFTFSDGQGLASLGLTPGEVVGRSVFEVYRGQPALLEHLHIALGGSPHAWTLQAGERTHETHTTPPRDAAGRLTGVVGAAYDLTEHKRLEQQLAHQAFHDALTGLPNRALFLDRLEHALARAERRHSSVAVLFVDMYPAKNGGKARCAVFDRQMNADAMERLELEGDLRSAIAQDELVLHYQPIVSLDSGALQEVEALVR